jgi:hypothetical protein
VLLYEMLTGLPPFYDENTNEMYRKILAEPLHFPGPDVVPPAARDLLTRLLDRDATRRLGSNGASEIKVSCRLVINGMYKAKQANATIGTPILPQHRLAQASRPQVRALVQAFCARRARHGQLRQGIHQRGADRQLRRRPHAQSDYAAAIRRMVVQQAGGGSWRCGRQYLAEQRVRPAIDGGRRRLPVVAIDGDFLKHGGKAEDMGLFLLSHDLFPVGKSHARACAVGRSYISNRKRFSFANANAMPMPCLQRKRNRMTLPCCLCVLQG